MPGRPTKFTTTTKRRIYKALRLGATKRLASQFAGLSYETMRSWERRGEDDEGGPYSVFLASVKRCQAEACMKALEAINEASPKHWQAAAWLLERRYPEEWGKNRTVSVESLCPPVVVELVSPYSDPWLEDDEEEEEAFEI